MVSSQLQWLSSWLLRPVFSEPKRSATRPGVEAVRRSSARMRGAASEQRKQRVLQIALTDGCGADDEGAIGYGIGESGAGDRVGEDLGGVDCGAGGLKGDRVIVDHAQMAQAEVMHGAGGCANVVWVARADQDDVDAVKLCRGRHRVLL